MANDDDEAIQAELDRMILIEARDIMRTVHNNLKVSLRDHIAAVALCHAVRKDQKKEKPDESNAGESARKYSNAFANAHVRAGDHAGPDSDAADAEAVLGHGDGVH